MFMPGFTDEALLAAYSHLLDNKAHGSAFVKMNDSHRVLWLRSYLAMHYYVYRVVLYIWLIYLLCSEPADQMVASFVQLAC